MSANSARNPGDDVTTTVRGPRSLVADAGLRLLAIGIVPVRVDYRAKEPSAGRGWQNVRPTAQEVASWRGCNVGVLLGSASGNLVDVDLDCAEAIALAPYYLPPSAWVSGRSSKPRSHYLMRTDELVRTVQLRDENDVVMLEMRSEAKQGPGHQTVIPPSTHKTGEAIEWDPDYGDALEQPPVIAKGELVRSVQRLARATFFMRRDGLSLDQARAAEAAYVPPARKPAPTPVNRATVAVKWATCRACRVRVKAATGWVNASICSEGCRVALARKYLAAMPAAISGSGGHRALFLAACALRRGFALDEHTALDLLANDYNPRCQPTWSTYELEHKNEQAEDADMELGYLLEGKQR